MMSCLLSSSASAASALGWAQPGPCCRRSSDYSFITSIYHLNLHLLEIYWELLQRGRGFFSQLLVPCCPELFAVIDKEL